MKLGTLAVFAVLAGTLMVSACANTIRGAGQDTANAVNATQSAGHKIEKAAQ
ncbi:hypothetical protein [Pseudaminobacter salicylatoxidans]|uniref:entericidin domain-containing protein n=1 Tax=Pseudaminobacter salicylatoxidans TaxID=93369 RepID=UPI00036C674B|nr:hypothetical protein [Pseudaminobacter salicylatoxidans]